jgi:hypothetical protein
MSYYKNPKSKKSKDDEIPWFALGGFILFAISLILIFFTTYCSKQSQLENIDKETSCNIDKIEQLTIFVIDTSDKLTPIQQTSLNERLWNYVNNIEKNNHQIQVFSVDKINEKILEPLIKICNPGDEKEISSLTGNKKITRLNFEKNFKEKIDNIFADLLNKESSDKSPIMESVQSVAVSQLISNKNKFSKFRIILISDLLQNSENFSFYKGDFSFDKFVKSDNFRFLKTDFKNAEIELYFLNRKKDINLQNESLRDFWIKYFQEQNATVTRFLPIEG